MKIVILGPPGSGKGTQADLLSQELKIPKISTGDLFRENISQQTPLGIQAKSYLDAGDLVPSDLTCDLVRDRLDQSDCAKGFILDGFPRSVEQAKVLTQMLTATDKPKPADGLDAVLSFVVSAEVVLRRTLSRGREDDVESVIRRRLEVYEEETAPVVSYYEGSITTIDAIGGVDEVFQRIMNTLRSA